MQFGILLGCYRFGIFLGDSQSDEGREQKRDLLYPELCNSAAGQSACQYTATETILAVQFVHNLFIQKHSANGRSLSLPIPTMAE